MILSADLIKVEGTYPRGIFAKASPVQSPVGLYSSREATRRIRVNADGIDTSLQALYKRGATAAEWVQHPVAWLDLESIKKLADEVIGITQDNSIPIMNFAVEDFLGMHGDGHVCFHS